MTIIRIKPSALRQFPVTGAGANILEGAVLMPGVSAGTNLGALIPAATTCAKAVGILAEPHNITSGSPLNADADPAAGTVYGPSSSNNGSLHPIYMFEPGAEVAGEMDQSSSGYLSVASATATTILVTSIEQDLDGSWGYVVSGTGVGQVFYVVTSIDGTLTIKSALTTQLDSTSKIILMRRRTYNLIDISSDATKIKSNADDGAWPVEIIRNEFKYAGAEGWIDLDPTAHHNFQLKTRIANFRQIFVPKDTFLNPLT